MVMSVCLDMDGSSDKMDIVLLVVTVTVMTAFWHYLQKKQAI